MERKEHNFLKIRFRDQLLSENILKIQQCKEWTNWGFRKSLNNITEPLLRKYLSSPMNKVKDPFLYCVWVKNKMFGIWKLVFTQTKNLFVENNASVPASLRLGSPDLKR
jgi:hypothetical protein